MITETIGYLKSHVCENNAAIKSDKIKNISEGEINYHRERKLLPQNKLEKSSS